MMLVNSYSNKLLIYLIVANTVVVNNKYITNNYKIGNYIVCIILFYFPQFLITQRKNADWARRILSALPEIDVGRVGVKGAKKYFEAKQLFSESIHHKPSH